MLVRPLTPADAAPFNALRLEGLRSDPTAFASSFEEEVDRPLEVVAARLDAGDDGVVLGAFDDEQLVGVVGLRRVARAKEQHKAYLWGMYVTRTARGLGVGRQLVRAALDHATLMPGLRQVHLGVSTDNEPARVLYASFGFEPFGLERAALVVDGAAIDEWHMVLAIEGRRKDTTAPDG